MEKSMEQSNQEYLERKKKYAALEIEMNAAIAIYDKEAIKRIMAEMLNVYETR